MKGSKWNEDWLFWEDKDAFALIWSVPEQAQSVCLPHDPMIRGKAYAESPAGGDGGYRDGGSYVYYKELFAPEKWRDQSVKLCFDGISRSAMVYVNGQRAALVPYAYTTFCVALDDYLRYGQVNQIRVCARTGDMPNSRWYSGAGIYRDVRLLTGGLVHVPPQGVRVTTADLEELALVRVETRLVPQRPGGAGEHPALCTGRHAGGVGAADADADGRRRGDPDPNPAGARSPALERLYAGAVYLQGHRCGG